MDMPASSGCGAATSSLQGSAIDEALIREREQAKLELREAQKRLATLEARCRSVED